MESARALRLPHPGGLPLRYIFERDGLGCAKYLEGLVGASGFEPPTSWSRNYPPGHNPGSCGKWRWDSASRRLRLFDIPRTDQWPKDLALGYWPGCHREG